MKKRFFAICLVSVVLIALIAVLVPSCTPTERCTIEVKATLGGSPWSGAVQYTLTGPGAASPITGTSVEDSFTVDCGNWTCAYISGGPSEAYLDNIAPSATQSVSNGGTITFTLNFKLEEERQCTIKVKATLCDVPWQGAVSYTLTPVSGSLITGTTVEKNFTVDCGSWTYAYVSGGPSGAYLESITPSAMQSVSGGGAITFTLNFELNQDAGIQFLTWTRDGIPIQGSEYEAVPCQIIDAHFQQWVNGCQGYAVNVTEKSWLKIMQVGGLGPVQIYVANNVCAVVKAPAPLVKLSQVATFNGTPVEPGMNIPLALNVSVDLDVETAWQLVKCLNYTKTINWFGISKFVQGEHPVHPCVLFELVVPGPGQYMFILQTSASVALVNDVDVNLNNNSTGWSPPLILMVNVPQ